MANGLFCLLTGLTVEMHGNINQLVCPSCGVVVMMTPALLRKLRSKKAVPCTKCDCQSIRCRIMLYDDAEGNLFSDLSLTDVLVQILTAKYLMWLQFSCISLPATQMSSQGLQPLVTHLLLCIVYSDAEDAFSSHHL